ncbi:FecR family protein [Pedobacter rhizosphaerae]|uniref:FecR family protein n=1 Tax=Pedobacter rhizosphaerae TaxID=390241 RepID=A0A1H9NA44_9SPHI|nr:FecR family protein [Pedobacter rhizosphaerae]SER32782.1 FecR family protein [Pedobacter rhizosphaerae]
MDQKSFLDLLTRYNQGNVTEAEKLWINKWYHKLGDQNLSDLSDSDLQLMEDRSWIAIGNKTQKIDTQYLSGQKPSKSIKLWRYVAIAASITLVVLIGLLYTSNYNQAERSFVNDNDDLALINETNNSNRPIIISLSDQSRITLEPGSNIIYPKVFAADKRTVFLKGNAFFSVSKNPKKPFLVFNEKVVVKVLGTSFFVRSSKDNRGAQVSVRTGKVQVKENEKRTLFSLSAKKLAKPILLTPNQKGVFANHSLKKTLIEKPLPLAVAYNRPSHVNYNFKEESLKKIFATLSCAYGIEIRTIDTRILDYTFTGDLADKGLYEQLDLICGSISRKYTIQGTSIVVSDKN